MKRYISAVLAATVIAGLTACGGGAPQASPTTASSVSSPSPTASPTRTSRPVPNMAGKPYVEARNSLNKEGYLVTIFGMDGKKWTNVVPDATVKVVSTEPAAGVSTSSSDIAITVDVTEGEFVAAAKAAADAEKLASRYSFSCSDSAYSTAKWTGFKNFQAIWPTEHYKSSGTCRVAIADSSSKTLVPTEQALIDLVASKGGDVSSPMTTVQNVVLLCAKLPSDYADQVVTNAARRKAEAAGALSMCPDAPHAALLTEAATAVKVSDGNKVVGKAMEPGTYKTKPGVKDCYWSRNTGGGDIIDNNFVGFAPDGVTVTVYPGEGFESQRCAPWTKIG